MTEFPSDVVAAAKATADLLPVDCPPQHDGEFIEAIAAAIMSERQKAEKDALRYRWLRDGHAYLPEAMGIDGGEELDCLIDKQMAEGLNVD